MQCVLVWCTVVLAATIPQLGNMIALIGAFSSSAVALIFPPLIHLVTLAPGGGLSRGVVFKNVLIMVLGFIGFIVGTVITLMNIVDGFKKKT